MSYHIKLLPAVGRDVKEIMDYYNEQKRGLGTRFFSQLVATIQLISKSPSVFQIRYKNTRQASIKKFPMHIYYNVDDRKQEVVIFAILHSARNPQIWKDRI